MPARKPHKKRGRKVDATGRSEPKTDRFVMMYKWERESPAYRWLCRNHPRAALAYIEMRSLYTGQNNNGELFISQRDMRGRIGGSPATICRCYQLLEDIGLLACNERGKAGPPGAMVIDEEGNLVERKQKATTYWLTAVPRNDSQGNEIPGSATKEFMSRALPGKKAKPAKKDSLATLAETRRYSGEKTAA
jgi:DNA-binding transcriptional regulator YhcF (GntR family)